MPQIIDQSEKFRRLLERQDSVTADFLRISLKRGMRTAYQAAADFEAQAANAPTRHAAFQTARYADLLAQLRAGLDGFNRAAASHTTTAIAAGIESAHKVMSAQIQSAANDAGVNVKWNPVPLEAFMMMSSFTSDGSPLTNLFTSANAKGADRAAQALRTGVLLGWGSQRTGAEVSKALNSSAYRGQLIARTELHRTARETQRGMMAANAHLYEGWTWRAATDKTTCAICWSLHGTFFPVQYGVGGNEWHGAMNAAAIPQPPIPWAAKPYVPSMYSHPNCRCALVPRPRSFAEILGDPSIPDARPPFPAKVGGETEGERMFRQLPKARQLSILGPSRFPMYQADPRLSQFVYLRPNAVWGDTLALRPLCR